MEDQSDREFSGDRTTFRTLDGYPSEEDACKAFDLAVSNDRRFSRVYGECVGRYAIKNPFEEACEARIDRILMPSLELQNAGWVHGPIGVEIKRSGIKIAPPIAQCIDYLRASFEVKPGFHVPIGMVFLFPCPKVTNGLESIMAQHRVGECRYPFSVVGYDDPQLYFRFACREVLSLSDPRKNAITRRKVGSR